MGLSQRREKQRIQIDPQNKNWSTDSNRFGYKLLKSLGYEDGQSLGLRDGLVENIKVKRNSDSQGIGCTANTLDNWLENQFSFDSLLKGLSSTNPLAGGDPTATNPTTMIENKIKKISNRHSHRKKFIEQKCMIDPMHVNDILGVKQVAVEESNMIPDITVDMTAITTTSTSVATTCDTVVTNNLQEYFAKKMADKGLTYFNGVLAVSRSTKIDCDASLSDQDIGFHKQPEPAVDEIDVIQVSVSDDTLHDKRIEINHNSAPKIKDKEAKRAKRAAKEAKRIDKEAKRAKKLKKKQSSNL